MNVMTKETKKRTLYYGKGDLFVYRTYANPLYVGEAIPESNFAGNNNIIMALNVTFEVRGDQFLSSFVEGDNTMLVATDSMKNFILRHAASYEGATVEGFIEFVSRRFMEIYPQAESIRMKADRLPFDSVSIAENGKFTESDIVFQRSHNHHSSATLELSRENGQISVDSCISGISDLQLIKVSGSSFSGFIRDEYTTLPETSDRPLFIYLNISWIYEEASDALMADRYVFAEQIRDMANLIFHQNHTPSIQNLIYLIGGKVLARFPQLAEIRFESNNRTWETIVDVIPGSKGKVFTEPRPPFGFQGFSMTREDLTD
jgi:urate oxidase/2-oxo-4-hydroxy-4-carboxy-5-ureidoimidazoline decarboxylase